VRADRPGPTRTESATWARVGRRFRAPLLLLQFPPEVAFGFLGRVLPTHEPIELSIEAHRIPARQALDLLHGARSVANAELVAGGGTDASELEVERSSAEELGRLVARRTQELWKVGVRLTAIADARPRVEAVRSRLSERLGALGFRVRIPRYEVARALAPAAPGESVPRPSGYWQMLPTDGLAALFPFSDESIVEPHGILVGLALADASPVFLDRWQHASQSWGLFGTTGSGKTFAAGLYLLRSRWLRPGLEVIVLDPLGEFAGLVRALGGTPIELGAGGARLNPLDPATTGGDRAEKASRVGAMLRAAFPSLTDEEGASLDAATSRLFERGGPEPTFHDLTDEVSRGPTVPPRLGSLLEPFRSGSLRSVDGPTNVDPDDPLVSVGFRGVPDEHMAFHLSYVLDWAYGRLRKRPGPKLLIVDESHLLLRHGATADFLDRVVRHVRHFGAGLLLLSQSPEDFLARPAGRGVLRNLYATAFLRLPEVSEAARAFFGLTGPEAEWLPHARLPREAGYAESLWRIGELHLPLALIASSPEFELLSRTLGSPAEGEPGAARTGAL